MTALDHLAAPASPSDVTGAFVADDPAKRSLTARYRPASPSVHPDALESLGWRVGALCGGVGGPLELVESHVHRGPAYGVAEAGVKPGDWVLTFRADPATWSAYRAGAITPTDALRSVIERKAVAMSKAESKRMRKARQSVDLSGGASTAAGRQSDEQFRRLIAESGRQTSASMADTVMAKFDRRVGVAKAKVENATGDFERTAARSELASALRARAMAKMVAKENAHANGRPRSHMGPGWTDLFGGSSLTLPDDPHVHGR